MCMKTESSNSQCTRNKEMDVLAARIELGIARSGIHILDENKLAAFRDDHEPESDDKKSRRIREFAASNGFDVQISSSLQVAIFRKPS